MNNFHSLWVDAKLAVTKANEHQWRYTADGTIVPSGALINAGDTLFDIAAYDPGPRWWWLRIVQDFQLHPVISFIIEKAGVRPKDWHLLLIEWPHVSADDPKMIAYTRNEVAGRSYPDEGSKRLTKTTIGKYLSRHWPDVRDDVRRDWAGRYNAMRFELWETPELIIKAVECGPRSCMKSTHGSIPFGADDNAHMLAYFAGECDRGAVAWERHTYSVYSPDLGWAIAVRLDPKQPTEAMVVGRALVHKPTKTFVRSFASGTHESSTSFTDEQLEAWLDDQGFTSESEWQEGIKLALVRHPDGGWMAPYLDGDRNTVEIRSTCLVISDDGDYVCDNTDGTLAGDDSDDDDDSDDSTGSCEECGDNIYADDDYTMVYRDEEVMVCESCCTRLFTYVRGKADTRYWRDGYREYYVKDGDVVRVDGKVYDGDNLPDEIRTLHDGEYAHEDDYVYIEEDDAYYLFDDDLICECEDDGEYHLRENCWQDFETDKWYFSDDEQHTPDDGHTYHRSTVEAWPTTALQITLELEEA